MSERAVFDPDEIRRICERDLLVGLRRICEALDSGELQGKLFGVAAWGFADPRDTRAHVILKIDLAAEVFRWENGRKLPLPARKRLDAGAYRELHDGRCPVCEANAGGCRC